MKTNKEEVTYATWASCYHDGCRLAEHARFRAASQMLKKAVHLATELALKEELIDSLLSLGDAQRLSRGSNPAKTTFLRAALLSEEFGMHRQHGVALASVAKIHLKKGQLSEARPLLQRGVALLIGAREQMQVEDVEHLIVFMHVCGLLEDWKAVAVAARYAHEVAQEFVGPNDAAPIFALASWTVAAIQLHNWDEAHNLSQQIKTALTTWQTDRLGYGDLLHEELQCLGIIGEGPDVVATIMAIVEKCGIAEE